MQSEPEQPQDSTHDEEWPPLVRCIFENNAASVSALIADGEDPNGTYAGRSLLGLAAYHGLPEVVAALIAAGACVPPNALATLGDEDITDWKIDPIERELDYAHVAEILLAHGASPNVTAFNDQPLISTFPPDRYPHLHRLLSEAIATHKRNQ